MNIITIFSSIMLALIFIGIAIGMLRGWQKSLIRTGILFLGLIIALLITPSITSGFIAKNVSGSTITVFSQTFDFEKIISNFSTDLNLTDIFADGSVTNELIISIMNVIVNVVLFLVIFLVIEMLSLLIYWIVLLIIKIKTRHDEKEPVEKDGKFWGLRILAGFIGMVGSLMICFAVMTPVYGVIRICDGFLEGTKTEEKASAASLDSFMGGSLYYTEDKNIGKIEEYIEKYAEIREDYNSSFVGGFSNITGMSKLGGLAFERLTTVQNGGLKLNLTDEFVQLIKTYNLYKKVFVEQNFDIENNAHIDSLVSLYDEAIKSEVLKEYIVEFIPKISDRWINDEKFLGISNPVQGEWKPVMNAALVVFKVENINRISNNFKAMANAVKVANNYEIIEQVNSGKKMEDILLGNGTFVEEEVVVLTSTVEFRENISIILNESFEVLYEEVIGEKKDFGENKLTNEQIAELNMASGWAKEANNIHNTIKEILKVYEIAKNDSSPEALLEKLENIGTSIDYARDSLIISKPYKIFITDFIKHKTNLKQDIKDELLLNIETKWDTQDVDFAKIFKAIQESALIAKDISSGNGNVSLDNLSDTLRDIADDTATKEVLADILAKDMIQDVVGEEDKDTAGVMTDMLNTFVTSDKVNGNTIEADIIAGNQILDIVDGVKNNQESVLGDNPETKQDKANEIVSNITGSAGMMELVTNSTSAESSALTNFTEKVKAEDKTMLETSINNAEISADEKTALKALFGIA